MLSVLLRHEGTTLSGRCHVVTLCTAIIGRWRGARFRSEVAVKVFSYTMSDARGASTTQLAAATNPGTLTRSRGSLFSNQLHPCGGLQLTSYIAGLPLSSS